MNPKKNNTAAVIRFRHRYNKLTLSEFTTIRGKSQIDRLRVGETLGMEICGTVEFHAQITRLELKTVAEMSPDFLAADANYPGCTITSQQQFINLLNSFRPPVWAQVTLSSPMTVIYLRRVENHDSALRNPHSALA